jgi:hypothetical protein
VLRLDDANVAHTFGGKLFDGLIDEAKGRNDKDRAFACSLQETQAVCAHDGLAESGRGLGDDPTRAGRDCLVNLREQLLLMGSENGRHVSPAIKSRHQCRLHRVSAVLDDEVAVFGEPPKLIDEFLLAKVDPSTGVASYQPEASQPVFRLGASDYPCKALKLKLAIRLNSNYLLIWH